MNKKFIKVSLGILIFLFISLLSFTLIFGGKKADYLGLHITSQKFLQDKEINSKKGTFKQ